MIMSSRRVQKKKLWGTWALKNKYLCITSRRMPLIITAITISWINPSVINEIIIIYSSNAFLVILLHQIKMAAVSISLSMTMEV